MMNLLQVQDDLKNFSQDQLVKEMQQPSGSTPQFLVLSELNRRKRVKGDFEARQAKQQPTVAEEAVASAGVPQQGMMGMPEAMAPQSAVSEGVGTSAPMKMASGGLAQFGNEIRNSMGQEIDPYLDGIQQEAEQKFNIDLDDNINLSPTMAQPRPAFPMFMNPRPGYRGPPPQIGIGGKGMARPAVLERPLRGGPEMLRSGSLRNVPFGGQSRGFAEGGVIKAQDGLPDEESYLSKFGSYISEALNPDLETVMGRVEKRNPFGMLGALSSPATDATLENMEKQENSATINTEEKKEDTDAIIKSEADKPAKEVSTTPKTLTLEEELAKRQAGLDKDRNFDKYMALAQAGLGILASDKPTLAQAVGEGGMKGLDAFREANKRYEEGLTDILNARVKLKAAKKTGLSQKDAITAISSIDSDIAKLDENLTKEYDESRKSQILAKIAQLNFQKRGLMPLAGYSYLPQDVSDSANTKS